jgi:acetyltransferase-like isoleucine patch superfamily enzyme
MSIAPGVSVPRLFATWPHQVIIGKDSVLEEDIYFKFNGPWAPGPNILIGKIVFLGRGVEFNIRKRVTIGSRSAIASGCKFIDHDHAIAGTKLDEVPGPEAEIEIGEDVWLGCNVIVLKGVTIGSSAVVGAGSIVTKSIPAGEIWAGVPAHRISSRQEHALVSLRAEARANSPEVT